MFLYESIILLFASILSILFYIVFNALVLYDEEEFDYREYNCYG